MSIYAITLKRELLGGDGEQRQEAQTDAADDRSLRGGSKSATQQQRHHSNDLGPFSSGASPLEARLNYANWLDCLCDVRLTSEQLSEQSSNDSETNKENSNSLVSRSDRQHSRECLENRRKQLQRLEEKAREIVHSVNVTLEISANLSEAKRIIWYKNERELTSSERPVLYVSKPSTGKKSSVARKSSSIKRTRSTRTSRTRSSIQNNNNKSDETCVIEQTRHEEIVERIIDQEEGDKEASSQFQQDQQNNESIEHQQVIKCRQESNELGSKLTIFDLQDDDYGQYICRLIDSEGRQLGNIETQLQNTRHINKEREDFQKKRNNKLFNLRATATTNMDEVIEVKEGDLNIQLGIQILPETNEDEELMSEEEKREFIEQTTISWFKDDVKLQPDDPQVARLFQFSYDQQEGFHRLIVRKATKETEGIYTCLVENESGNSSCSTQLVVGPGNKPKLTSQLQDVTVYVGQSLEFRIKSSGLPPIDSCQWFKDDELLIELDTKRTKNEEVIRSRQNERISMSRSEEYDSSGKEEDKLLIFRLCIDQLKLDDTGRYKCRIINEHGYDESDCMVKVLQEIIEEHEEIEETIEETLRLGGGKKSSERQEEEEQTITESLVESVQKRQKTEQSEGMDVDGQGPEFKRKLQSKQTIIISEETTILTEELIVSTKRNEWSGDSELLKLSWFVDGQEIRGSGAVDLADDSLSYQVDNFFEETTDDEIFHKLVIKSRNTRSLDSQTSRRTIECRARNSFGEASTSGQVNFVRRPRFVRRLEDQETSFGETVQFKVSVSDEKQESVDDVRLSKDGKLIYSSKSDGKQRDITTSSRARIRVTSYEETITEETTSTTTTRRYSRPSLGERRSKVCTYEITIDNTQIEQQGTFECEAVNEAGSETCRADLEVFAEPKLVTDLPEGVRVQPGKEIRLHVEASGSPEPVFSWFKDGLGIAEEEDRVFTETRSSATTTTTTTTKKRRSSVTSLREEDGVSLSGETLIISDARPEDEGIYKCKVENRLGQVETRNCKLTIIGHGDDARSKPRIIKDLSKDQIHELDEGDTLNLKVLAEGHPKPQQRWFKDETTEVVTTTTSRRVSIEQVGQEYALTIKRSTIEDSGQYKVVLTNELGSTDSKTVTVKVNKLTREREEQRRPSAPSIVCDSQDKTVGLGSNVSFDVQVAGHPKPLITWYKNGRRLTESGDGRVTFVEEETTTTTVVTETYEDTGEETGNVVERKETTTISRLVIKDVRESDEAIYSLKAENDLGATKSSLVSLTVDKRKEKVDELLEKQKRKEHAEEVVEEETTVTKTTTTTVTEEEEEEEEAERRRRSARQSERKMEVEEEEDEFDENGERRTKTRITRKTTTKTTTTTTTEEEEEEEEQDEEARRRRKQIEQEEEGEEERSSKSKRRTRQQEEQVEEEERNKRRSARQIVDEVEDEVEEKTRTKVTQMDHEDEVIEEEQIDEQSSENRRSSKDKTKTRRKSGHDDEVVEEMEEIEEEKRSKRKAPRIVSAPRQVVAGLGSSPELEVEIFEEEEIIEEEETVTEKVTWLKNGEPIPDRLMRDKHIEVLEERSKDQPNIKKRTLRINSLRSSDEGEYVLRVEKPQGTAETEPISLKVDRSMRPGQRASITPADIKPAQVAGQCEPTVTSVPEEIVARIGSSPQIEAEVSGLPKPELSWFKDGQPIPEQELKSGHLEVVDLPTDKPDTVKQALKIHDLKPNDVAAYHVKAENPLGEAESEPTNIRVDRSMAPSDEPKVSGLPQPEVSKSEPLAKGVDAAPAIVSMPEEIVAGSGSNPQIVAEVSGSPQPQITWLKDGQPISDRDLRIGHVEVIDLPTDKPDTVKQALKINDLRPSDLAQYAVKAENPLGEVESEPTRVKLDRSMGPRDEAVVKDQHIEPQQAASSLPASKESAPSIVKIPEEIKAGPGSSPQIMAEVSGLPKPELSWFKDGRLITDRELRLGHLEIIELPSNEPNTVKQALKINDLRPTDVAAYHVTAVNPLGEAESKPCELKLDRRMSFKDEPKVTPEDKPEVPLSADAKEPAIVSLPDEIDAGPGSSPQIEAEVVGEPQPQLTWLKDGQPISERDIRSGHVEVIDLPTDKPDTVKQALKINDLRPTDVGEYQVKAENDLGQVESKPCELKLDRSMSSQDEPKVIGAGEKSLELPEDACAPLIVSAPEEVVAGRGSTPQVEVEAKASPKPDIQWFKDGQPIGEDELRSGHLEVVDLPTDEPDTVKQALKIHDLKPNDVAAYHVKAKNPVGEAESEPTNVRIDRSMAPSDEPKVSGLPQPEVSKSKPLAKGVDAAPAIVSMPEEIVAGSGSNPQIVAEVSGSPQPQITWLKDGQPISDRDQRIGHVEVIDLPTDKPDTVKQALQINDLRPSDVAAYKVKAENPLGEVESEPTKLRIDRSMGPRDEPQVIDSAQGEDEVPMETDQTSDLSQPRKPADMIVPQIVSSPQEVLAAVGSNVKLEVQVLAEPKAEVEWLKDGQPISDKVVRDRRLTLGEKSIGQDNKPMTCYTLEIDNLKPSDVGSYKLVASNPAGSCESQPIQLKTDRSMSLHDAPKVVPSQEDMQAPEIVSAPHEVVAGPGSVPLIEAEVSGKPTPEVSWFKDGQPLPEEELKSGHLKVLDLPTDKPDTIKQALEIYGLKPADVAAYHIKAENPLGEVESEPTKVRLDKSMSKHDWPEVDGVGQKPSLMEQSLPFDAAAPSIVSMPEEVVAGIGSSPLIEAEVSGNPLPELSWFKDGRLLTERDLLPGHLEIIDLISSEPNQVKQALKINELKPSDVAAYHVRAKNPLGEVESEPTNLRIDRSMGPKDEPQIYLAPQEDDEVPMETDQLSALSRPSKLGDMIKPQIVSSPQEVLSAVGSNVKLQVQVLAEPKAEVEWLKEGQPMSDKIARDEHLNLTEKSIGQDNKPITCYTLEIDNLKPSDVGSYKLVATNPAGSCESQPIQLKTDRSMSLHDAPKVVPSQEDMQAPEIVSSPREVVAGPGSVPLIEAEVSGKPAPEVSWFKDGQPLPEEELKSGHLKVLDLPTDKPDTIKQALEIDGLKPADVAAYHIKAENPLGEVESEPTNVRLDRSLGPRDEPKVDGVARKRPSVAEDLVSGGKKPEIISMPNEVVAGAGSAPQIEVEVTGEPKPDLTWLKNGKPLTEGELQKAGLEIVDLANNELNAVKQALKINEMKPSDAAAYTVKAENPLGTVESEPTKVRLDKSMSKHDWPEVDGVGQKPSLLEESLPSDATAPSIVSMPEEVVAGRGSSPQLEAEVCGKPAPEVTWFKDGQPITEADLKDGHLEVIDLPTDKPDTVKQALKINDLKPSDVAAYHVKAENPLGEAESEPTNLRIDRAMGPDDEPKVVGGLPESDEPGKKALQKPRISQVPRNVTAPLGSNPTLSVEVLGHNEDGEPTKIEWFKDGKPIHETPDMHIEFESLPDGTQKLLVNNLKPQDLGVYTLRATNAAGSAESGPITLSASSSGEDQPAEEFAPEIINVTEDVLAGPGSRPELEVHLRASPNAEVTWFKDGRPIAPASVGHVTMPEAKQSPYAPDAVQFTLKIDRMKPNDAATYSVVARNPLGTAESKPMRIKLDNLLEANEKPIVKRTVETPAGQDRYGPQILSWPDEVRAGEGSSPGLEVVIRSKPAPETQWFKDGQPIEVDGKHVTIERVPVEGQPDTICEVLRLQDMSPQDAGAYHVHAENPLGEAESQPTRLSLDRRLSAEDEPRVNKTEVPFSPEQAAESGKRKLSPQIKRVPHKIVAPLGSSPVIEVQVVGEPAPEVNWFKDGRQVSAVHGHLALVEAGGPDGDVYQLCITNLKAVDQGDYVVVATNELGEAQSAPISLVVSSQMSPRDEPQVVMEAPESSEADDYLAGGRPKTGFAPTIIRVTQSPLEGQVNGMTQIQVEVKASPQASVQWLLDGSDLPITKLQQEGRVSIKEQSQDNDLTTYTLEVSSLKPSDAGTYQLVAENPFGTARSPAVNLTLGSQDEPTETKPKRKLRAPTIKRVPSKVVAKEGTSPVLEVEVSGEPIPEVVWFKNGVKIESSDAHFTYYSQPDEGVYKLIVNECTCDDETTYSVVATNEAGQAESSPIKLKVEAQPVISGYAPQVVSMTDEVVVGAGSSPLLEIVIKASPRADVTWFRDGQPLDSAAPGQPRDKFVIEMVKIDDDLTKYTLKINKLTPPDLGAYHVRAENALGCIESEPINVRIDRSMSSSDAPQANKIEMPFDEQPEVVSATKPLETEAKPKRKLAAPTIKRMPHRIVAGVGSSPVIEVIVSGEPKPEIVWFKNGKRLVQSERITFEELPNGIVRLCFTDLKMTDQAEYSLTVTNEAGQVDSGPIEMIVDRSLPSSMEPCVQDATEMPVPEVRANADGPIEAPQIRGLESTKALPGQTVKLEAEVSGNPKPEIKWLKDGDEVELNIVNEVPDSNRHSLTLRNVNDLYDGVYALEATNVAGTARKEARVSIVDELKTEPTESAYKPTDSTSLTTKRKPSLEEPHDKPFIKKGLKFSQVNQGRSIKFEVQIDGIYDELIWMKDGQQINLPAGAELFESLDSDRVAIREEDEKDDEDDTSTLKASDDEASTGLDAETDSSAKPKRKFAPRILMRPRNVVAGPGSRVAFEVLFEGEPKPEVVWYKNNEKISTLHTEGKISIEEFEVAENQTMSRLVIEDVQSTLDEATYYVMLENPYGTERSQPVTLEVDSAMPASDDLANYSASDTLIDSVIGGGQPLKRGGRAPRILLKPRSAKAPQGSRIVFEVQVAGEPEPVVNWYRDGRVIKQTADGHVSIEEFSNGYVRLVLDNIQSQDVAQYHVVAENKHGSDRTIPVSLELDETSTETVDMTSDEFTEIRQLGDDHERKQMRGGRPPRILLRPKHLEAPLGSEATLEVNVVGQSKPSSIVWHKNGKRLQVDGERIRVEKVSESYEKLVITKVESDNAGEYTVSAENDFGTGMSHGAHLKVTESSTTTTTTTTTEETTTTTSESFFERYVDDGLASSLHGADSPANKRRAPRFTVKPHNKKAPLGSKVDFEVKVTGEPKPDVVWYKNGRRIHTTEDGRVRVEEFSDGGSRLVLEDLEEQDHGVYSAEASNEWGKTRTEDVQLRVTQRTETSERVERSQRGTARVTTRTKKTRSHYTFTEERHGYVTLTISDAQLEHDGDYKLVVRNKWGEASTQAPLVVIPKVEPRSTLYGDRSGLHDDLTSSESGRDSRARRTPFDELEDYGHELDKSVGIFGSESRYQSGEDTYLLQLRDTEFPLRLRKYLRFGARQSPSLRSNLMDAHWGAGARVTVRERRKFREVMDEEIEDEKMGRDTRPTPMRLQQEVGTCGYAAAQLEHLRVEAADRIARKSAERGGTATPAGDKLDTDMMPPFFRVKLKDAVVEERCRAAAGEQQHEAVFYCLAAGEPKPDYTWFRNDVIITPDIGRMQIVERPEGGSELRIRQPTVMDSGCFKCVARNVHGNVTTRARLRVASRPSRPEPPECSSATAREVFLQWRPPRDFAADAASCADVLAYRLEVSESSIGSSDEQWRVVAPDIGHEFYVVDDLKSATNYSFRVSARNKFGWSDSSYSAYVTTASESSESASQRLPVPHEMRERQYVSEVCDPHLLRHCEDDKYPHLNYSIEQTPVSLNGNSGSWRDGYSLQAEIARGRFSIVSKGVSKRQFGDNEQDSKNQLVALKFISCQSAQEAQAKNEFDILRSLQHEKVVQLLDAYRDDDCWVLVMERLSGLDVLTYLSSFTSYTEETVSKIIQQVMDAIEYLHFRGMCLLELLPDNVVMTNGRTTSLKLVDFSAARFVPRSGARVPLNESQSIEYCPPEVIAGHEVSTASDVWCIGVLTYVLLSGFSPFKADTEEETRENVRLGRYKYDHIYGNCTPEVTRFLINVFKKHSSKRPTIEQLYENKWLLPNEFMIRKRQHATFRTDKITKFAEEFHKAKRQQAQGDSMQELAKIIGS